MCLIRFTLPSSGISNRRWNLLTELLAIICQSPFRGRSSTMPTLSTLARPALLAIAILSLISPAFPSPSQSTSIWIVNRDWFYEVYKAPSANSIAKTKRSAQLIAWVHDHNYHLGSSYIDFTTSPIALTSRQNDDSEEIVPILPSPDNTDAPEPWFPERPLPWTHEKSDSLDER